MLAIIQDKILIKDLVLTPSSGGRTRKFLNGGASPMESNNVHLLPHNEEAFIKLKKCLEYNQFVAINHATGTGKSFIILKYLYENKGKRILFLSPSYPINDQLIQEHTKELGIDINEFSKIDTLIYGSLLKMDMYELASNYDIIVLDEYHRCGAKKWGIKVNELLGCIKQKHLETKVIGTTATEIRYLDNERNMNNILFDGVCASTLTLADAMLREILPVPIYINSLVGLSTEYERAISKIYEKSLYDRERNYYLQLVAEIRSQIDDIVNKEEDISQYIKKNGKHLVFSSTIDNIEKDKVTIDKLLNCRHNEYVVHSKKTKKANARTLTEFRYDSNPATLYCINILNEGVHVKDVDSIFMLRPTTSPIIFFQQLGRLLSYSRRKDKVVVFDLVNNIKRSPHIYQLYIGLYQRANELIEIDPDNKDKYLNIVKRFKIVDATSKIYDKLDILNSALAKENFYKKRIDFVIEILQKKGQINEVEEKIAKMDLFKYYKYITLEQFRVIKKFDVNKLSIFSLSEEEFVDMLSGEENIYQKEKKLALLIINKINTFYENDGYFPSILGESKEECIIARDLMKVYDGEKVNESIFENKNLDNLTEYEKIVYGISKDINYNLLYGNIDKLIENNLDIFPSILSLIQSQNTEISKIYFDIVLKYNANRTKSKINNDEMSIEKISAEEESNIKALYTKNYEKIAKECMLEIQNYDSVEEYLKKLAEEIVAYINTTKRMPVYYMPGVNDNELEQMRMLYIKKMIFYSELETLGYISLFDEVYNSAQMELAKLNNDLNKDRVLEKLLEFLKEHNGDMPSLSIGTDRGLALEVNKIKGILDDEDIDLINLYKSDDRTREVVIKYITFVKEHKRYPLTTATDEEEKALLNDYIRNELYFSEADKKLINNLKKSVSSREAMQNAYAEMLKQKKRR